MKALTREPSGAERIPVFPDAAGVAALAQLACLLEASAPKPGNVSPGRHFADTRYEHFLASAAAIGGPLAGVGDRPLGAAIRLAIESTSRFTSANTNLGIVLLLVPLARAAALDGLGPDPANGDIRGLTPLGAPSGVGATPGADSRSLRWRDSRLQELRTSVHQVLAVTTVDDARDVYAAIRLASPGGLGEVETEDVAGEPTLTLLDAMRLAAHRDGIAREYATGFATTFDVGTPALIRARRDGFSWDDAVVETFLTLLAAAPDTHIARRGGGALADDVTRQAAAVIAAGGVRSDEGRRAIAGMDAALRGPRNTANPGTTADLTAATIFAFLLAGGWHMDEQ
jgi:triphosphoribosyl-dephospho-CoA synthase